jgi:hypothetical protein
MPRLLLELQCLQEIIGRHYAYKQYMSLLESQLQILPDPFDPSGGYAGLVRTLIDNSISKLDSETGYLAETSEYRIFSEFLLSAVTPWRLRAREVFAKGDFTTAQDQLTRSVCAYVGLLAGHPKHVHVLKQMCARFLFDQ